MTSLSRGRSWRVAGLLPLVSFGGMVAGAAEAQPLRLDESPVIETTTPGAPTGANTAAAAAREAAGAAQASPSVPARAKAVAKPPAPIVVKRVVFGPSRHLEAADLARIEAALIGTRHGGDAALATAVGKASDPIWVEKKQALAKATVAGVDRRDGTVRIEFFEAEVGEVRLPGTATSRADYLAWRFGIRSGDLADTARIEERTQRLVATDGAAVDVAFAPGRTRGATDLTVKTGEPEKSSAQVSVDNYGEESKGKERLNLGFRIAELTGWNDPLRFSSTLSRGSATGTLSYVRAIGPDGTLLSLSGTTDWGLTVKSPRTESLATSADIALDTPWIAGPGLVLRTSAALTFFRETSDFAKVAIKRQEGQALTLGAALTWKGEGRFLAFAPSIRAVLHDDRIAGRSAIGSRQVLVALQAGHALGEDWAATLTANGQLALDDDVPSKYLFAATGNSAVRGYPLNLEQAASGWYARTQIERSRAFRPFGETFGLTPFVFTDIGEAFDLDGTRHTGRGFLVSSGVGLAATLAEGWSGDVYLARPFSDAPGFVANEAWTVQFRLAKSF